MAYEKIVEKQRKMILAFEMKQSTMFKGRLDRVEVFVEDLAMEQAKINAKAGIGLTSSNQHQNSLIAFEDSQIDENCFYIPDSLQPTNASQP